MSPNCQQYATDRIGAIHEVQNRIDRDIQRVKDQEKQKGMYQFRWGIHRGTLMSRDVGDHYYFETIEECKAKYFELKAHYNTMGYQIWYAHMYLPGHNEYIEFESNSYY